MSKRSNNEMYFIVISLEMMTVFDTIFKNGRLDCILANPNKNLSQQQITIQYQSTEKTLSILLFSQCSVNEERKQRECNAKISKLPYQKNNFPQISCMKFLHFERTALWLVKLLFWLTHIPQISHSKFYFPENPGVPCQKNSVTQCFSTELTFEIIFSGVYNLVHYQITSLAELVSTDFTFEILLSAVNNFMPFQIP